MQINVNSRAVSIGGLYFRDKNSYLDLGPYLFIYLFISGGKGMTIVSLTTKLILWWCIERKACCHANVNYWFDLLFLFASPVTTSFRRPPAVSLPEAETNV